MPFPLPLTLLLTSLPPSDPSSSVFICLPSCVRFCVNTTCVCVCVNTTCVCVCVYSTWACVCEQEVVGCTKMGDILLEKLLEAHAESTVAA